MRSKLNIGIIGAGRIGKVHAETLAFRLPEANPAVIADVNPNAAARRGGTLRHPAGGRERRRNSRRPRHQTPSSSARPPTRTPTSSSRPPAPASTSSARSPSTTAWPRSTRRWPPSRRPASSSRSASTAASTPTSRASAPRWPTGEIGTPHLLHIISRDPAPPPISYVKVSGGMFLDMTIHDFDMARFLIGDEVRGDLHRGRRDGGPGDRRGGRRGYRRDHAAFPQRRHRHHRQQPQGRLRLRPARGNPRQRGLHRHRQLLPQRGRHQHRASPSAGTCR